MWARTANAVSAEYFGVCADYDAEKLSGLMKLNYNLSQTDFEKLWMLVSARLLAERIIDEHHASKDMARHQAGRFAERGMMNVLAQADIVSLTVIAGMIEAYLGE